MARDSPFVPHDLSAPVHGAPTGPLTSVRVAVKDAFDIAGARTGAGSPEWLAEQRPADRHADVVERILAAGATVTAKTVCDELFYSLSGVSAHYGTPANVRAPGRIPGGSSSGSAAAVAAGACDVALGTDTGGSVRVPAAFCGVYGLRPTHGRVPLRGCVPMAPSFDVAGWFAETPEMLRAVGTWLLDDATAARGPVERILLAEDALVEADASVADAVEHALDDPERVTVAPGGLDAWRECFRIVQAYEVWQSFGEFVTRAHPVLGPGVKERVAFAATVTDDAATQARRAAAAAHDRVRQLAQPGTVIAMPTVPCIAPSLDANETDLDGFRTRTLRLTCIAGLAGLPQVTAPIGPIDGCPAGLSFIGWRGGDEALLGAVCDRISVGGRRAG